MVDDDLALDEDLGDATIVFEGPEADPEELTVPNEHVAYFQDHWLVKTDETDGRDLVRRIPAYRVYHVERSVEEFESEIRTLRDRVESVAEELRTKIPVGDRGGGAGDRGPGGRRHEAEAETGSQPHTIDVERGGEGDGDRDD